MKRKYVHISEYDLSKAVLDRLDIELEEDGRLYMNGGVLKYKSKFLTLVGYKDFKDFNDDTLIPFRPFTNVNHANYLINLFSDLKDCETLFEYGDSTSDKHKGKLRGSLNIEYAKSGKTKSIVFEGMTTVQGILGAILLKFIFGGSFFKENIRYIFKIDGKLSERRKK